MQLTRCVGFADSIVALFKVSVIFAQRGKNRKQVYILKYILVKTIYQSHSDDSQHKFDAFEYIQDVNTSKP